MTETVARVERAKGLDQLCINTIRTLAIDAVQAANSGHPGTPMAHIVAAAKEQLQLSRR